MPSKTLKRGSRRQVWNGTAEQTAGGLRKEDLDKNKRGRIVSKKKTARMLANNSDEEDDKPKEEKPKEESGFWNLFK
jgi:hypothetical protein